MDPPAQHVVSAEQEEGSGRRNGGSDATSEAGAAAFATDTGSSPQHGPSFKWSSRSLTDAEIAQHRMMMSDEQERQRHRELVNRLRNNRQNDSTPSVHAVAVAVLETPQETSSNGAACLPGNAFLCPISRKIMSDPVICFPTGITYDRKYLCQALLSEPDIDPATQTRHSVGKLHFCDNLLVRRLLVGELGDKAFERYDDSHFHQEYNQAWESKRMLSLESSSVPPSTSGYRIGLYERLESLRFGMNRSQIDMETAFALVNCPTDDAIIVATRAFFLDPAQKTLLAKSCPKDSIKAEETWRKAQELGLRQLADQGNPWAQVVQGRRELKKMTDSGWRQAHQCFHLAANSGNLAEAYWLLGGMTRQGQGVKKNIYKAIEYYLKAADKGHATAQSNLGVIYFFGADCIPTDYDMAMDFFLKSAEQGEDQGQFNLGYMYEHGLGVPQSYTLAATWYSKAADQGHKMAMKVTEPRA